MILFTIIVALFVGFASITAIAGAVITPVLSVYMFISNLEKYQRLGRYRATPRACPYCGSESIQIKGRMAETERAVSRHKASQEDFRDGYVLICQDCSRSSSYIFQGDIDVERSNAKTQMKLWAIIIILSIFAVCGLVGRV